MTPADEWITRTFLTDQERAEGYHIKFNTEALAQQAFKDLGAAAVRCAEAIGKLVLAAVDAAGAIVSCVNFTQHLLAAEAEAALNTAPPRVRHLAVHGKKYRTRKKNMHRALRNYKRR